MWQLTNDTWHVTPDMWHLTCDTWIMTNDGWWIFSKNFSSPALPVWYRQCVEDSELKDDSINPLLNDKGVYRTAPATPGLLIIKIRFFILFCLFVANSSSHCLLVKAALCERFFPPVLRGFDKSVAKATKCLIPTLSFLVTVGVNDYCATTCFM